MIRFFDNLKLAKKMLLAPIVVVFLLILLAGGIFFSLSEQKGNINDIYNNRFKQYKNSARMLNDISNVQGNLSRILNWIKVNYDKQEITKSIKEQKETLAADVVLLQDVLKSPTLSPEEKKNFQAVLNNLLEYQKSVVAVLDLSTVDVNTAVLMVSTTDEKYKDLNKFLSELLAFEDKLSKEKYNVSIANSNNTMTIFGIVVVIALLLSFTVSILVTRLVLKPIYLTIHVLSKLADGDLTQNIDLESNDEIGQLVQSVNKMRMKMGEAVGKAMLISDGLSDASSEEAASLEETSASLDEIASMTKRNAENTMEANKLMLAAKESIKKANESMAGLTSSMKDIATASEQTQKIVKSIDEIAFQTNLLALNAAVEAARAGESGAGFAVVADEVRSLAMRATESAKNSSNLIADIVTKVRGGEKLVTATGAIFSEVTASSERVSSLMGEISAASHEQSQGIEQVNRAVADMSTTTQSTAANAAQLTDVMSMFKTQNQEKTIEHGIHSGGAKPHGNKPVALIPFDDEQNP
jgi:methyl-accepting chemotaxis protein